MMIARGDVVILDLAPAVGHEQRGVRRCVVVRDPAFLEWQKFPLVAVVPLTGSPGVG